MGESLPAAVLAHWALDGATVRAAGGTAGRTWRVERDGRAWFVRRRGARTSAPERIAFDHGLRGLLAESGFPTVAPLEAPAGGRFVVGEDGVYEVYWWVDGLGLTPDIAERGRLKVAAVLARFHELAAAYQAPCEERVPQFGHYPIAVEQHPRFDHPEAFAAVIAFVRDSYATPSQVPAVERATEWVRWLGQAYSDEVYAKLPKSVIHGDFNGCNLLFASDGRVVGVFDYDWAWRDTRVRDVGEALFFFGACRDEAPDTGSIWSLTACPRFDTARMADFLHSYRQASPLSDDELAATPLAMLGRWVACRTEGAMKVPERRRAEFLLADFEVPFRWYQAEAEKLLNLANR